MVPLTKISEWKLLLLMMMIYETVGTPELVCPDVGYLGSPAHLTCIPPRNIISHGYMTSQGEVAAVCNVSSSSCTTMGNYTASTINQTHSRLTIPTVQQTHAGQWTCTIPPWSPLSCNLTVVRTSSTTLDQNVTPRMPNAIDIIRIVLVTVTVPIIITITIILTYVCFKRRTIQQKVPPVLECPDPPFMEFKEPLHNTYASVEDLGAHGSGSKKDTSPPCTEEYADTGNYAAVGDTSVPDTKTRKNDLPALMDAGGYSTVADRRVTDKGTQGAVTAESLDTGYYERVEDQSAAAPSVMQGDLPLPIDAAGYSTVAYRQAEEASPQREDTAKSVDTGYYETVEDQSAAAPSVMQGDLPLPFDAAGYSAVAYRQAAETSPQREDTAKSLDTGYYETVEDQSAATPSVMQGDLPLPIDAAGYSTVAVRHAADKGKRGVDTTKPFDTGHVNVEDKSDAEPNLRQGDLPALTDVVGYSTVDDFKPCPGGASFSRTGEPESVPNQIEGQNTNRPLCELYATVDKNRGKPRLTSTDATTTGVMCNILKC